MKIFICTVIIFINSLTAAFAQTPDMCDYPEWITPGMSKDEVLNHYYNLEGLNEHTALLREKNMYMISENILYEFNYNKDSKLRAFYMCFKSFSGEIKDLQTVVDYFIEIIHLPIYLEEENSGRITHFWEVEIVDDDTLKRWQTFLTVSVKKPYVMVISWLFTLEGEEY
ncbi:MAG: hypothetical protein LBU85_05650 [Treponema sp.]|jgi:hypothetical protein|nr:hypothetical protein [Treponema sp.]